MKVAYLGPEGTFTEKAAKEMVERGELMAVTPIRKVVKAVDNSEVDYGVVPLENFYNGEVRETLDALTEAKETRIIRDRAFSIVHCLGVLQGYKTIEQILSKDQALEQCSKYLCENYSGAQTVAVSSTSEAARIIRDEGRLNSAAIASKTALGNYDLEVLAEDICPNNKTRFILIGIGVTESTGNDKTFVVFHPCRKDKAGELHRDLGFFAGLEINLDYIQSRPDGKGGYFFYIELYGHEKDEPVQLAFANLRFALDPKGEHPDVLKVLGSYPNTDWKNGK